MDNRKTGDFARIVGIICFTIIMCVFFICIAYGGKQSAGTENNIYAGTENNAHCIECGSCGAHVYEYWYVENINDGTPVEVCRYCYENYMENQ